MITANILSHDHSLSSHTRIHTHAHFVHSAVVDENTIDLIIVPTLINSIVLV